MKKPKKLPLPKKPSKMTLKSLENYLLKVKEVEKKNKENMKEYAKFLKLKKKVEAKQYGK